MRRDDLVKALAALPETANLTLTVADLREAMDGEQPAPERHPAPRQEPDELLSVKQAAKLMGVSARWVYEHHPRYCTMTTLHCVYAEKRNTTLSVGTAARDTNNRQRRGTDARQSVVTRRVSESATTVPGDGEGIGALAPRARSGVARIRRAVGGGSR